jgi:acetyltransferase
LDYLLYKSLFAPASVALVGASARANTIGGQTYAKLLSQYKGTLFAVNPGHKTLNGKPCYRSVEDLPQSVDLAVIATRADRVPQIMRACAQRGVKSALLLSIPSGIEPEREQILYADAIAIAKQNGIRVLGPHSRGIIRPELGFDASLNRVPTHPGHLALVSQSATLGAALLDIAQVNQIGFSSCISLGSAVDVDFAEILDFLAADEATKSILVYMEWVRDSRRFMSALRAACRAKPVVILKAGRHAAGSHDLRTHSGNLGGLDQAFDAAIKRAGAVRISTIHQLFAAAKTLSVYSRISGNRLAIVSNGGGPGILAADRAADMHVTLAKFSPHTMATLNATLPSNWSQDNPVDVLNDADAVRFSLALKACLDDAGVDGVLAILTPQNVCSMEELAQAVVGPAQAQAKPVLAVCLGESIVTESRNVLVAANIPSFRTPEVAVDSFSFITDYQRNQKLLMQLPGPLENEELPDIDGARLLIDGVLASGRTLLSDMECRALLAAFRIPALQTFVARDANEALALAEQIGFPVAMKVSSPDITHKSDVNGVWLNVPTPQAVRTTYNDIVANVTRMQPGARIEGIAIQPMVARPHGRELLVGISRDEVFGPVLLFGAGGTLVEMLGGHAATLPPINRFLAAELISRSSVARLLGPYRNLPAIHLEALENVLLRVSEMACELPWLREMDINPLIVDETGALATEARIVVGKVPVNQKPYAHMAIHPYPAHLVSYWHMPDGTTVTIRPMRPEDAEMEAAFVRGLSDQTRYFRFLGTLRELTPSMLLRFTQYDYDRELALVAMATIDGAEVQLGVARYVIKAESQRCEFSVVVADDWQHRGVGHKLMTVLMDAARAKKLAHMDGEVLGTNNGMLSLMESLGFQAKTSHEDPTIKEVTAEL